MKLLYFIVLTGLCMACHQPRVYRINGSLPGALDGYVVKLYNIDTYPDVLLDSTVIKDEKFQLEGTRTFEYPKYCRLVVDMTPDEPDQRKKTLKAYRFFADNTAMEFQCQMDSMPSYYWEPVNKEHNVTLTGSPTQDLYRHIKPLYRNVRKENGLWRIPESISCARPGWNFQYGKGHEDRPGTESCQSPVERSYRGIYQSSQQFCCIFITGE